MTDLRRVTLEDYALRVWGRDPPEDRGAAALDFAVDILRLGCGPKTLAELVCDPYQAAWIAAAKMLEQERAEGIILVLQALSAAPAAATVEEAFALTDEWLVAQRGTR